MSQIQIKKTYKATFILDTRGLETPIEELIEMLKKTISDAEGEVGNVENLGRKDFIRITDKDHPGDIYLQIDFQGPPECPEAIHAGLKLDKSIKRIHIKTEKS